MIGRAKDNARESLRDAIIRLRAVNAVLDECISTSGTLHEDPRAFKLRANLDVPSALQEFARELTTLVNNAFVAEMEWANAAKHVEAWKGRRLSAERDGEPLLAQQAFMRQQEEALLAAELRLELEEWQQLVADYEVVIEMLRSRLPS